MRYCNACGELVNESTAVHQCPVEEGAVMQQCNYCGKEVGESVIHRCAHSRMFEPPPDADGKCDPADTVGAMRALLVELLEQIRFPVVEADLTLSPKESVIEAKVRLVRTGLYELIEALDT